MPPAALAAPALCVAALVLAPATAAAAAAPSGADGVRTLKERATRDLSASARLARTARPDAVRAVLRARGPLARAERSASALLDHPGARSRAVRVLTAAALRRGQGTRCILALARSPRSPAARSHAAAAAVRDDARARSHTLRVLTGAVGPAAARARAVLERDRIRSGPLLARLAADPRLPRPLAAAARAAAAEERARVRPSAPSPTAVRTPAPSPPSPSASAPAPGPAAALPPAPAPAAEPVPASEHPPVPELIAAPGAEEVAEAEAAPAPAPPPTAAEPAEAAVRISEAVPYSRRPDGADLLLDVYAPGAPAAAPRPGVILVHGGAWRGGHRSAMGRQARALAEAGMVALSISYRLDSPHPFPDAPDDLGAALAWVRANAADVGVDPDRVAAMGVSAGANLAALLGTTASGRAVPGGRVAAVVSWSGPMDLADMATDAEPREGCTPGEVPAGGTCDLPRLMVTLMSAFMGCPIDAEVPWVLADPRPSPCPGLYAEGSPLEHVGTDAAPTLLVHAESDPLVHVRQARAMAAALGARGVPHRLVTVPGEAHADALHDVAMGPTLAFLKEALG